MSNILKFSAVGKTKQSGKVYFLTGENNGNEVWYYLNVEKLKEPLFLKDITSNNSKEKNAKEKNEVVLEKYGEVLYFGFSTTPPSYITKKIEMDYKL